MKKSNKNAGKNCLNVSIMFDFSTQYISFFVLIVFPYFKENQNNGNRPLPEQRAGRSGQQPGKYCPKERCETNVSTYT